MNPTDAWTTPLSLRRERRTLCIILPMALLGLLALVRFVHADLGGTGFDTTVAARLFAATDGSPALSALGRLLDILGGNLVSVVLVLAVTGVLLSRKHRHLAGYVFASALGGVLVSKFVKSIIDRPRPPTVGTLISESTSSFPSGHATSGITTFVALAVVALVALRPGVRWWVAVPLATLGVVIGVSRVALGVHWPTDILGGWALGVAWTSAVALVVVLAVERRSQRLSRTPVAA